ncbi:MAG: transcription termination/antitermination NusG family protein, partial [bacterium]
MIEDEKMTDDIITDENLEKDLDLSSLDSNISEIPNFEDEQEDDNDIEVKERKPLKDDIKWYVIHTYSGYENKVKANIEKIVENRDMYDEISDVIVPMQDMVEVTKSGQKKTVSRKVFPGYVFVKMSMNDETWYVVRNTRGVTSFVGPGSKPVPLTEDEILNMGIESFVDTCDIEIGDVVLVNDGP